MQLASASVYLRHSPEDRAYPVSQPGVASVNLRHSPWFGGGYPAGQSELAAVYW